MNDNGGVEVTYACEPDKFTKCTKISDADFSHIIYELREYGKAVKVINGFSTHVAVHPYKLLIDARGATNKKRDYYNVCETLRDIPKYAANTNVQYTLFVDSDSPINPDVFWVKE